MDITNVTPGIFVFDDHIILKQELPDNCKSIEIWDGSAWITREPSLPYKVSLQTNPPLRIRAGGFSEWPEDKTESSEDGPPTKIARIQTDHYLGQEDHISSRSCRSKFPFHHAIDMNWIFTKVENQKETAKIVFQESTGLSFNNSTFYKHKGFWEQAKDQDWWQLLLAHNHTIFGSWKYVTQWISKQGK